MNFTNSTFLNHLIPMLILLQIAMEIYVYKRKARQMLKHQTDCRENYSSIVYTIF